MKIEDLKANGQKALDRQCSQLARRLQLAGSPSDPLAKIEASLEAGEVPDLGEINVLLEKIAALQKIAADLKFHAGQAQAFASLSKVDE